MKPQRMVTLLLITLVMSGCGSPGARVGEPTTTPTPTPTPAPADNSITISPSTAVAGSPDVLLTVTGSNFEGKPHNFSQAVWSSNGIETALATTIVSSTQLTVVLPADLLVSPASAKMFIQTGDPMGDSPLRKSESADFSVTAVPISTPTITLISPDSAPAGSPDVAVNVEGSNFTHQSFRNTSIAFWTTDPGNLHDHGTMLATTFISSSQLTILIPAALLESPGSVQIVVLNGDEMGMSDGYFGYPKSNSVNFSVTP